MNRNISLVLLAIVLGATTACAAGKPSDNAWVDSLIAKFEAAPVTNPPRRILRFHYRNQVVYYVPPVCCDQPSTLYAEQGTPICEPDGGIGGRGDGRCADFRNERRDEVLIWADRRTR